MKIVYENPPVLDAILAAGMRPNTRTVFTFGDTIYFPLGNPDIVIEDHLLAHETIHSIQQGDNPMAWWERYLTDVYFRIAQEAEAYGHQYTVLCKHFKDRNKRNLILRDLGRMLSGPIYGNVIGLESAISMIRSKSNVK